MFIVSSIVYNIAVMRKEGEKRQKNKFWKGGIR